MSFFSDFSQTLFGTGSKYSDHQKYLSREQILVLVSQMNVSSLSEGEEKLIEESIDNARKGDGKISLRQIDQVLFSLQNKNKISIYDRKGLLKIFEEHFKK